MISVKPKPLPLCHIRMDCVLASSPLDRLDPDYIRQQLKQILVYRTDLLARDWANRY
jgi:hypothetical protein